MADIIDLEPFLIGTPANGVNLYQVPNASMQVLEDIINATWNLALSKSDAVGAKTAAITGQDGMFDPDLAPTVTAGSVTVPTITAPAVNIPANIEVPDLYQEFSEQYLEIASWLTTQYSSWITTYAPNNQALYAAGESSLLSAIQSGSYLPASVQSQIWGDDSARILADSSRAQDAIVAQFAGRRFPLPADVSASAVLQIQQRAQDLQAESSRKIAIMSVEQYRFVIQQIAGYREIVLKAANDFVRALASAPDTASKLLGVGYDVQTKLISSAAAFYNADAQAKEVIAKVEEHNNAITLEAGKANQASKLTIIEDNLKALIGEITSVTQQAVSALNNLHVQASMQAGGSTITTQAEQI